MSESMHDDPPIDDASASDLTGTVLAGRYRILRKLGEGAMGAVYLGEHLKIGRQDAIKVLRTALARDTEAIARFLRGARNVSRIRHPNVCTIYDFSDTADGLQFLAMEYIPGETLKELLEREGKLPVERAVAIARRTADALQAAHDAGIVHRDLKPANIMVSSGRDGTDVVKVVDFDIAKASQEGDQAEEGEVTRLGFVVGTPEYMSPEQLMGEPLDGRSDVYSLALVLFRMLTGALPFQADSTQNVMIQRLTHEPLRLDDALAGHRFPPSLQAALDHALARQVSDRTASAAEFSRALEAVSAEAAGGSAVSTHGGTGSGARGETGHDARAGSAPLDVAPGERGSPPTTDPGLPETRLSPSVPGGAAARSESRRRTSIVVAAAVGLIALLTASWLALGGRATDGPPAVVQAQPDAASGESAADAGGAATDPGGAVTDPGRAGAGGTGDVAHEPDAGGAVGRDPVAPSRGSERSTREAAPSTRQPDPARGPGSATGEATEPPVDASPEPVGTAGLANVDDTLWRQLDKLEGLDLPPRAELEAVRDTALLAWNAEGVPGGSQALAAYVLAQVMLPLGDTLQGRRWAERAVERCVDGCRGYHSLLEFYRSIPR